MPSYPTRPSPIVPESSNIKPKFARDGRDTLTKHRCATIRDVSRKRQKRDKTERGIEFGSSNSKKSNRRPAVASAAPDMTTPQETSGKRQSAGTGTISR